MLTTRLPAVPVIVKPVAPWVAEALAFNVNVEVPDVELGKKEAVTPAGKPEADNRTLPLNPYSGLSMIVGK